MPTFRILELRRQLAAEIDRSLGPGSQHVIAPRFGIRQPRMSELSRGVVDRCSIEWLIERIHRLGGSVEISVTLGDTGREWRVARLSACRAARADRESATRRASTASFAGLIPNLE